MVNMFNIGYWVYKNADLYPDKVAVKDDKRSFTYSELNERTNRLASALKKLGLRKGIRVSPILRNCAEFVEIEFALAKSGGIMAPLNYRLAPAELKYIINDAGSKVIIYEPLFAPLIKAIRDKLKTVEHFILLGEGEEEIKYEEFLLSGGDEEAIADDVGFDDPHLVCYTAGTTGRPKGVILTHGNTWWHTINGFLEGMTPETYSLVVLPFFHTGGINGSCNPVIHMGGRVYMLRKFDPAGILKVIMEEKINGMTGVPAIFLAMTQVPEWENFKMEEGLFISGGAPLPRSLIRKYHEKGMAFKQGYGLTETAPGCTGMNPGDDLRKPGSVGKPVFYCDVKIIDNEGNDCPPGKEGEIIARGPNITPGYWNNPEETKKALRRWKDGNIWLFTGDIAKKDEDGYFYIVGRRTDMIISGGENIFPREIEDLLISHPKIKDVAVIGVPDEKWGEVPMAVINLKDFKAPLTEDEVLKFLEGKIARFKMPKNVKFQEEPIPRNPAGKILKKELLKKYRQ